MIVTWSGNLFTLRVSRCDFDGDYAELDQFEATVISLVVVIARDPIVNALDPAPESE
jgi:hypothetical protein